MRTKSSYRIVLGCVCVASAAALGSCAETHEGRVEQLRAFFAGRQPNADQRVVKSAPARTQPSSAEKPASAAHGVASNPTGAGGRGDPQEIEAYASRMESRRYDGDYQPNDHLSKIRRHQQSAERERLKEERPEDRPPVEPEGEESDEPEGVPMPAERSVVKTASHRPQEQLPATALEPGMKPDVGENSPAQGPPSSPTVESDLVGPTASSEPDPVRIEGLNPGEDDSHAAGPVAADPEVEALPKLVEVKVSAASAEEDEVELPEQENAEVPEEANAEPVQPSALPNEPAPAAKAVDTFDFRLQRQRELVEKDPNNIEEQFRLRLLYVIDGQDAKALAPIEGIDADVEEIVIALIKTLIAARSSGGRDPATWANRQLELIEELRRQMRARADLQIPRVVLCTSIDGYGRYEPIEPPEFRAGQEHPVVIYVEVDNFRSERTKSGMYRTLLTVRETVSNAEGQVYLNQVDENIEDLARQPRRDFYLMFGPIAIPPTFPAGEYTLKVEIEDVLGGKINSQTTKFKLIP